MADNKTGAVEETENIENNSEAIETLADDYAKYLIVDSSQEKSNLDLTIEDLLTRLDEYGGLIDLIRSDTSLCLNRTLAEIERKSDELDDVFKKIDKLESYVAMVKQNVSEMEASVEQAEKEMGSFSSVRKVFNAFSVPSFLSRKSAQPREPEPKPPVTIPVVFRTKDYLRYPTLDTSLTEQTVEASPRNERSTEEFCIADQTVEASPRNGSNTQESCITDHTVEP